VNKKKILVKCALLDEHNVYQGMVEIAESDLTDRHLTEIKECDLPTGQYRWVENTFVPLPKKKISAAAERKLYEGYQAMEEHGIPLPVGAAAWMAEYSQSFDMKGLGR
jgi:hypothetical protein